MTSGPLHSGLHHGQGVTLLRLCVRMNMRCAGAKRRGHKNNNPSIINLSRYQNLTEK